MRHLICCFAVVSALPVWAGEFAVLSSGFRVRAERHEIAGAVVRLHTEAGVTELPAQDVVAFEAEEVTPPPPKPAVVAAAEPAGPTAVPAQPTPSSPKELVRQAALAHGLPPEFVQSVARAESAYRTDAVSPKGAIGLMQLMPGTAKELGANPHDPQQNAHAGAKLLAHLLVKYDGDTQLALAAYNAGEGAVAKYKGVPPYRETRQYVRKVISNYVEATKKPKS